jgi:DNA-binding transcriptional ArsR family regulator
VDDIRPGYYAIIPADVRYDDGIPPNAKLLYGEISALIGKDGFCYASNAYFMNLYGFSDPTISRLISQLEKAGYIRRELEKDKTGQVVRRKLYLSVSAPEIQPPIKNDTTLPSKIIGGGIKNDGETNKSITVKEKNKKEKPQQLTDEELRPLVVSGINGLAQENWGAAVKNDLFRWVMALYDPNRTVRKAHPVRSKLSVDATFRKLAQSGKDPQVMINMLCTAIEGGWQGVQVPSKGKGAPMKPPQEEREYRCL